MKNNRSTALLFFLSFFLLSSLSAQNWKRGKINGEGSTVSKTLNIDQFKSLGLAVNADLYLSKGNTQQVKIEAQQNIIDNIKRTVEKGSWSIEFDKNVGSHDKIKIYITLPTVKGLSIAGSGNIVGKDDFNNLDELDMSIAGSGNIEFSGSGNKVSISIAGNGDVDAENFKARQCDISIAGNGDCTIDVDDSLNVSIAGNGDVNYKGSPRIKTSIVGNGDVNSLR